jgi:hypothetical protein
MKENAKIKNPWTPEDEQEHFPCTLEWWAVESFFKSIEDKKKWSLKAVFTHWLERKKDIGSIFNLTLFDEQSGKHLVYYLRNDNKKLDTIKDSYEVRYEDCFIKGSYPNYKMFFNDKKNNIKLNINYKAESLPHWNAQEITNGWLPMGLGFYRYGFIPKNQISGTMEILDKKFNIEGKGYYEHVWGDFWYDHPLSNILGVKKTISVYLKLIKWWLHNHKIKIPSSIKFGTDNNPFGYDWAWALFDNGWTIFYGNALFWLMNGPSIGNLIFSKDGKNFIEFGNITFHYNKLQHSEKYDFTYPTEFELRAKHGKEILFLKFKMTSKTREYVSKFPSGKYWLALVICEAPGTIEGFYSDGKNKVNLSGIAKIEPQRQVSVIGHNTLKINFLKPPKGFGISFDFESHYLKKKMFVNLRLAPKPRIKFDVKRIDSFKINIKN